VMVEQCRPGRVCSHCYTLNIAASDTVTSCAPNPQTSCTAEQQTPANDRMGPMHRKRRLTRCSQRCIQST
jgi:hypothetical protein